MSPYNTCPGCGNAIGGACRPDCIARAARTRDADSATRIEEIMATARQFAAKKTASPFAPHCGVYLRGERMPGGGFPLFIVESYREAAELVERLEAEKIRVVRTRDTELAMLRRRGNLTLEAIKDSVTAWVERNTVVAGPDLHEQLEYAKEVLRCVRAGATGYTNSPAATLKQLGEIAVRALRKLGDASPAGPAAEERTIEADRYSIRAGTLVVDVDAYGRGDIKLDGKEIDGLRRLEVVVSYDALVSVKAELVPLPPAKPSAQGSNIRPEDLAFTVTRYDRADPPPAEPAQYGIIVPMPCIVCTGAPSGFQCSHCGGTGHEPKHAERPTPPPDPFEAEESEPPLPTHPSDIHVGLEAAALFTAQQPAAERREHLGDLFTVLLDCGFISECGELTGAGRETLRRMRDDDPAEPAESESFEIRREGLS